jgi:NADPH:quinone reductase-like Zn-dependent oxidoreductase
MKADVVSKYKSPMQASEVAEPTVGDRDVLIDVHAAGLNMLDAKIRDGEFKLILPYKPPFILGHDLAGVVTRLRDAISGPGPVAGRAEGRQGNRATRGAPTRQRSC